MVETPKWLTRVNRDNKKRTKRKKKKKEKRCGGNVRRDASEAKDAACDTGNSFTWRDGSQHPRCCRTSYGEEEKRARLSRHVGVRDAYKGAFMKRVFLSFDGSLAVQLKEPLDCVSRYRKLHKPKTSLDFFRNDDSEMIRNEKNHAQW